MKPSRMRPGFTLLETMIALGLIGVLIGTIGLFVNQIAGSREQMRVSADRDALATAIFDGLESACSTAIARTGSGSPGMIGTSRRISIASDDVVVSRVLGTTPQSVLNPETMLTLEFDEDAGRARFLRDVPSVSSSEMPLGAVRLRYLSDGAWSESWNSFDRGGLPSAIECSIWWTSPFEEASTSPLESDDVLFETESIGSNDEVEDQVRAPDRLRLMRIPDGGVFPDSGDSDLLDDSDSMINDDSPEGGRM